MVNCFQMIVLGALLLACRAHEDYIDSLNETPKMSLKSSKGTGKHLKDSLKVSSALEQHLYDLKVSISDVNENITAVNVDTIPGKPMFMVEFDTALVNVRLIFTSPAKDDLRLKIAAFTAGTHNIRFQVTDGFSKKAQATLQLEVFKNLKPVAEMKVRKDDTIPDLYHIDLSKSYDRDAQHGGMITQYRVYIDSKQIVLNEPKMSYNITKKGTTIIAADVRDNSYEFSEKVNKSIVL